MTGKAKTGGNFNGGVPSLDLIFVEDRRAFEVFEDKAEDRYQNKQPMTKRIVALSGMMEDELKLIDEVEDGEPLLLFLPGEIALYFPFLSRLEAFIRLLN